MKETTSSVGNHVVEIDMHILFQGSKVRKVWKAVNMDISWAISNHSNPLRVWQKLVTAWHRLGDYDLGTIANLWWLIWKARNATCFGGISHDPIKIAASALSLSWETGISIVFPYNGKTKTHSPTHLQLSRWEPPGIDHFKINIDAATSSTHSDWSCHLEPPWKTNGIDSKRDPLISIGPCLEAQAIIHGISLTYQIGIEDFKLPGYLL